MAANPGTLQLLAETLRREGWGRIPLRGDSMLPTLQDGWRLHVRCLPASDLRVGDVGVFIYRDVLTIHRLVWKKIEGGREKYLFQGDNNRARETVEADAILGRVDAAEGAWSEAGNAQSVPVGADERAFFYRNAFRLHCWIAPVLPSLRIPEQAGRGSLAYRLARGCFQTFEKLIAPRPRR